MIGFYKAVMILRSNKIGKHYADLKKIKKLYKSSFPKNERMRFGALLKSADSPMVDWAAYYDGEKLVGFTYLAFDEEIAYDYFQSVPEVCAAVAGFLRNQPIRDDFKGNYTLVDIGSGTVDASCFSFTRSPTEYQYVRSLYSLEVQPLGTTSCHHRRLDWLRALVIEAKESDEFESIADEWFDRLKQDLNTEEAKTLLSPLKDSCREYYQGIEITAISPSVDRKFSKKLTELIGRVRHKCMTDHFLTCQDVAKMPVFFCGGGARSKFYRDAFLYKHKNISWLRPERIIESDAISDLQETMTTPIRREDYDRLLVAYGLCAEEAPKSIKATHLESEQSTGFQNRYISKDDI